MTWRSYPAEEYAETVAKARGPLTAIGAVEVARSTSDGRTAADAGRAAPRLGRRAHPAGRRAAPLRPIGASSSAMASSRRCVPAGRPTELVEHVARLQRSAAGLAIHLPDDIEARLTAAVDELLTVEGLAGPGGDASIRITVSRGPILARGLLPHGEQPAPTLVVQAWPVTPPPPDHLERGLHLITSAVRRDPENPLAALKTISRADFVYARVEAREAGADDAIFLTVDGFLSEATSANLFLVRRGELATPALACAILPGTTRDWLLAWASRVGLTPHEGWLTTRDLVEADEAFISSSVAGILPVTRFAGEPSATACPAAGRGRLERTARRSSPLTMTRDELSSRTRQLIAEGDRLRALPSMGGLRTWLQLSDDLLAAAWGSMDRYHLVWLGVGRPRPRSGAADDARGRRRLCARGGRAEDGRPAYEPQGDRRRHAVRGETSD